MPRPLEIPADRVQPVAGGGDLLRRQALRRDVTGAVAVDGATYPPLRPPMVVLAPGEVGVQLDRDTPNLVNQLAGGEPRRDRQQRVHHRAGVGLGEQGRPGGEDAGTGLVEPTLPHRVEHLWQSLVQVLSQVVETVGRGAAHRERRPHLVHPDRVPVTGAEAIGVLAPHDLGDHVKQQCPHVVAQPVHRPQHQRQVVAGQRRQFQGRDRRQQIRPRGQVLKGRDRRRRHPLGARALPPSSHVNTLPHPYDKCSEPHTPTQVFRYS